MADLSKSPSLGGTYPAYPFVQPANMSWLTATAPSQLIDIKLLRRILVRRWWILAGLAGLVFLAAAYVTFTTEPRFRATAQVEISQRTTQVVDLPAVLSGIQGGSTAVDTEVEVISSARLLSKVVEALNLIEDPDYNYFLHEPGGIKHTVKSWIFGEPEPFKPTLDQQMAAAVGVLQNNLVVRRRGISFVIDVTVEAESPERARDIANQIGEQYLVEQLNAKFDATRRGNLWLDERLSTMRDEVNRYETQIEEFRASAGLLAAEGFTLTEQELANLNRQLVQQRADLAASEARLAGLQRQIDRGANPDAISEVLSSAVVSQLRAQQADIARRKAEMQTRYGPRHPKMQEVEREERDLQGQIDMEVARISSSLAHEVGIARERVRALEAESARLEGELAANNEARVQLRELEREAAATRELYEDFLERFKETSMVEGLTEADARILAYATTPLGPASPTVPLNLMLGLIAGLGLGAVGVALAELLNDEINGAEDVERLPGAAYLGGLPTVARGLLSFAGKPLKPADYLVRNPLSSYAEAVRHLRAALMFGDLDHRPKVIAVTSALPDEGKTTTALSLARMSSLSGAKTLLIDGDLRRGDVSKELGVPRRRGLIDVLLGESAMEDVVASDPMTQLDVLPHASHTTLTPRDVFGSSAFDQFLKTVSEQYDCIVIDTAPVLMVAETRVLCRRADAVLFVTRWRKTKRGAAANALKLLREFNANVAGAALTMVNPAQQSREGDDYGVYSSKKYAEYYRD